MVMPPDVTATTESGLTCPTDPLAWVESVGIARGAEGFPTLAQDAQGEKVAKIWPPTAKKSPDTSCGSGIKFAVKFATKSDFIASSRCPQEPVHVTPPTGGRSIISSSSRRISPDTFESTIRETSISKSDYYTFGLIETDRVAISLQHSINDDDREFPISEPSLMTLGHRIEKAARTGRAVSLPAATLLAAIILLSDSDHSLPEGGFPMPRQAL
jgi:hypothetical protein